jgi:hypothetical protein
MSALRCFNGASEIRSAHLSCNFDLRLTIFEFGPYEVRVSCYPQPLKPALSAFVDSGLIGEKSFNTAIDLTPPAAAACERPIATQLTSHSALSTNATKAQLGDVRVKNNGLHARTDYVKEARSALKRRCLIYLPFNLHLTRLYSVTPVEPNPI